MLGCLVRVARNLNVYRDAEIILDRDSMFYGRCAFWGARRNLDLSTEIIFSTGYQPCLTIVFPYMQKYKAMAYSEALKGRGYGTFLPYLYCYLLNMN